MKSVWNNQEKGTEQMDVEALEAKKSSGFQPGYAIRQTGRFFQKMPYPHNIHPGLVGGIAIDDQLIKYRTDRSIMIITGSLILGFIAWGILSTDSLKNISDLALAWVVNNLGWMFSILAVVVLLFMFFIGLSKFGNIPLGRDGEEPEYSFKSWMAMMFSAGIGIGLLFFGPYEPMTYFLNPPPASNAKPQTYAALNDGLAQTMLHWGLNAWAFYALVGCAIAYGSFRRGRVPLMSRIFVPLVGNRAAEGTFGRVIDMLAIATTLFGTSASLGIGALQIAHGYQLVTGLDHFGNGLIILMIALLTAGFIASAVSGVSKGVKALSNINMVLAFCLMLFIFLAGPTVFLLNLIPSGGAHYLSTAMEMLSRSAAWGPESGEFASAWTVFYWAWWISWSPFVGMFIARISRGRTIRQFVFGVLLVPTTFCLISFTIFGGTSMWMQLHGQSIGQVDQPEELLFGLLRALPGHQITSVIAMFSVAIFFITTADSASVVMGTLSQQGKPDPDKRIVAFWGLCMSGIAIVGLLVGGKNVLQGLQNLIVVTSLPFTLIIAFMLVALYRDLSTDPYSIRHLLTQEALQKAVRGGLKRYGDDFKIPVIPTAPGKGAGADFDSTAPEVTEWYQRTDEEGNPVGYDYHRDTYLDKQGRPVEITELAAGTQDPEEAAVKAEAPASSAG